MHEVLLQGTLLVESASVLVLAPNKTTVLLYVKVAGLQGRQKVAVALGVRAIAARVAQAVAKGVLSEVGTVTMMMGPRS